MILESLMHGEQSLSVAGKILRPNEKIKIDDDKYWDKDVQAALHMKMAQVQGDLPETAKMQPEKAKENTRRFKNVTEQTLALESIQTTADGTFVGTQRNVRGGLDVLLAEKDLAKATIKAYINMGWLVEEGKEPPPPVKIPQPSTTRSVNKRISRVGSEDGLASAWDAESNELFRPTEIPKSSVIAKKASPPKPPVQAAKNTESNDLFKPTEIPKSPVSLPKPPVQAPPKMEAKPEVKLEAKPEPKPAVPAQPKIEAPKAEAKKEQPKEAKPFSLVDIFGEG